MRKAGKESRSADDEAGRRKVTHMPPVTGESRIRTALPPAGSDRSVCSGYCVLRIRSRTQASDDLTGSNTDVVSTLKSDLALPCAMHKASCTPRRCCFALAGNDRSILVDAGRRKEEKQSTLFMLSLRGPVRVA